MTGWSKASSAAWRNGPGRARAWCGARRTSGRRRAGGRSAARWTRIWWVRPVSSRHVEPAPASAGPSKRSTHLVLGAGRPAVDDDRHPQRVARDRARSARRSMPCGALGMAPHHGVVAPRRPCGRRTAPTAPPRAVGVRATTSSPELPASRRWTMPGPVRLADAGELGEAGQQAVDERAVGLPAPGWTTSPAGLSTTITASSAWTTSNVDVGIGTGRRRASGSPPDRPRPPAPSARRTLPRRGHGAVDAHAAGVDHGRRRRAADVGEQRDDAVEPLAGQRRRARVSPIIGRSCRPARRRRRRPASATARGERRLPSSSSTPPTVIADVGDVEDRPPLQVDEVDDAAAQPARRRGTAGRACCRRRRR